MKHVVIALGLMSGLTSACAGADTRVAYRCAQPLAEPPQPASIARPGGKPESPPEASAPPPVQFLGCVEEDVALVPALAPRGEMAVRAAEAAGAGVAGEVVRFSSPAERDAAIREWLGSHGAKRGEATGDSRMFIAGQVVVVLGPGAGADAYAIFPESADAGDLCLTFVPAKVSRAYVPTLNNWCMDALAVPSAS